jgi:hypothetical protein
MGEVHYVRHNRMDESSQKDLVMPTGEKPQPTTTLAFLGALEGFLA